MDLGLLASPAGSPRERDPGAAQLQDMDWNTDIDQQEPESAGHQDAAADAAGAKGSRQLSRKHGAAEASSVSAPGLAACGMRQSGWLCCPLPCWCMVTSPLNALVQAFLHAHLACP